MQPRELVIDGLTAFSSRETIRFDDVSLFALVGPTGAGKSSVVDAITLALYGRIPRLHANEIAPVISTTATECTVGLVFTVRGRPYRAVRTIRRTKTGASTLEAALEQLDDDERVVTTLAGTADDVTVEVERLIGLTFAEFTKAVVLPQGEFAKVLRAKPSDRQSLLSRLLGVDIYNRVRTRAGAHARAAQERAEQTAHQIHQLGAADAGSIAAVRTQAEAVGAVIDRLAADTATLTDIRDRYRDAKAAATQAQATVAALSAIGPPPEEVREFGDRVGRGDEAIAKATATLEAAEQKVTAAESGLAAPEHLDALRRAVTLHGRTEELTAAVAAATATLTAAREEVTQLGTARGRAEEELTAATERQSALHRAHAAATAVTGLGPGDDCPVCASTLPADAPAFAAAEEGADVVEAAAAALSQANQALGTLNGRLERARTDVTRAETALAAAETTLADHTAALADLPSLTDAQAGIAAAQEAERQVAGLRGEVRQARSDLERAQRDRRRLDDQAAGMRGTLDRLRLAVAALDPPLPDDDVLAAWTALHTWAAERTPEHRRAAEESAAAVEAVGAEGAALRERMEAACAEAGVPTGPEDPRDRAVQHRANLLAEVDRLTRLAEMAGNLKADEADAREQALIGSELHKLLKADQFQRWLLDEATRALVAGASTRLGTLSSGRYELVLDEKGGTILVMDLANAGAPRSVRTLSGGETFLASLALALSLADQIAMSASGPVALESLFIDEGFGALDPETLDIAAGAIEQLGAGDRTVGVITHVAEMAERMPTRYEVQRTAAGSRVTRVDL